MPMHQTLLVELNSSFRESEVGKLAANSDVFAPGQPVHAALANIVADPSTPLHRSFRAYLSKMPGSVSEALRSTIHYALNTTPPTLITFAWAPSYDYELTVWQAPDTKETRGGITILLKSRYPSDAHPLGQNGAAQS